MSSFFPRGYFRSCSRGAGAIPFAIALIALAGCGSSQSASHAGTASNAPLVHLPADQAAHTGVHNEWWYVVGHVHAGSRTFGYETTIFKLHQLKVPGVSSPVSIYRTDVAITDESSHRFLQHLSYYFPASAHASTSTLNVQAGTAALIGASPTSMTLRSSLPGGAISMHLSSRKPPMYQGGRGYIPMGSGFSYYYSLPALASTGSITVAGKRYSVSGISWLDHQWGNWNWTSIKGWTWMALQLSNGTQLSLSDFRSTSRRLRSAAVLPPNGTTRIVMPITISSTGTWVSPHTHTRYPSGWIVRIPALHATMTITPTVKDQELAVKGQAFGDYWEGSGRVTGTYGGKPVTGFSYTELTGYAAGRLSTAYP